MNIIMAFNTGFLTPSITAIYTLFKHNSNINLVILYIDLSDTAKTIVKKLEKVGDNNKISFMKISDEMVARIKVPTGRWRPETFFRYFAHELFEDWDRCVWLDSDIMVRGGVDILYNINFDGKSFVGVCDNSSEPDVRLGIEGYVNAGILAMNLDKLRQTGKMEEFWSLVASKDYKAELPDQDAFNIVFEDDIKPTAYFWNTFAIFELDDAQFFIENARIVHFPSGQKPWNIESAEYFTGLFDQYPSVATFVPEYWDNMEEAINSIQ